MKRLLLLLGIAVACPLGAQPNVPTWTVSFRPTLDIGSDANTQTQFNGVTGILRMPGGEIVVANGTSQELRVFSPSGEYLRTLTPGGRMVYMRSLGRIWRGTGDTIYASEILATESNVLSFTTKGFVSKIQVGASNAGGIYPIDRFPDGQFVISAAPRGTNRMNGAGTFMDSTPLGLLSMRDLTTPKWIGMLRNETVFLPGRGGTGAGGRGREKVPYPYGRSTSAAVSGDRLWIGDSETGTITQYNSAGRGLAVFSAPTPARLLDTVAIRRRRAAGLSDAMNWNNRETYYPFPASPKAPRFRSFVAGTSGEMWIELFREDQGAPKTYIVVDRSGKPIGRVTVPRRMVPFDIGSTDVIGVSTDDDGLEHVVRYPLRRTPP
jgi:hypothetical protein